MELGGERLVADVDQLQGELALGLAFLRSGQFGTRNRSKCSMRALSMMSLTGWCHVVLPVPRSPPTSRENSRRLVKPGRPGSELAMLHLRFGFEHFLAGCPPVRQAGLLAAK
jgi:hypothetical protein